jgi:hypothetical protein
MTAEAWAILRRHPLAPEVPEDSVNPCLVVGARNTALGCESAAQDTNGGSSSVSLKPKSASAARSTGVARDMRRVNSRAEPEILRAFQPALYGGHIWHP